MSLTENLDINGAEMKKAVKRIKEAEEIYTKAAEAMDRLESSMEGFLALQPMIEKLAEYYDGPDWIKDLELDEKGELPSDLKRGVLSEDGIYNLLERNRELLESITAGDEKCTKN